MVASLIEMNNGVGEYDDFVGLVLNGLPVEIREACGISNQVANLKYKDFLVFFYDIEKNGKLNTEISSCDL